MAFTATIHRYLAGFHDEEKEQKREDGQAFIPTALVKSPGTYRYLAIREALSYGETHDPEALPFQTRSTDSTHYKLFGVVTNRDIANT